MRALEHPAAHAEAIVHGIKPIEYCSGPTRIRGRIYIYASLGEGVLPQSAARRWPRVAGARSTAVQIREAHEAPAARPVQPF